MTASTDQERAEFEKAWRERPIEMGGAHQKEVAYIWWMQAARRAPAVQSMTLEQAAASMRATQAQPARIIAASGSCAPAAPVPQGWVDPNDKTQKQYLPHIGERVLFKHDGRVYLGKHTGGSFRAEYPFGKNFGTWDCEWMYPSALDAAAPQPPEAQASVSNGTLAAPVQLPEPGEFQCRFKPDWDDKYPWTDWKTCTPESASDYLKNPTVHDWTHEVRKIYTEQQVRELLNAAEAENGK